jgi:hypothetical protein
MKKTDQSQPQLLSPLETELLSSVDELETIVTNYIRQENRWSQESVDLLLKQLDTLKISHSEFVKCQIAFNEALIGWANTPTSQDHHHRINKALTKMQEICQDVS